MVLNLDEELIQTAFGKVVGVSQQAVSMLVSEGVLTKGGTAGQWMHEYCGHLREIAAGRVGAGDLDLATERALLARAQREGQEIKNRIAQGEYAPIELLADVLATAAQAVVDRLEQIPADLRRACPDLSQAARDAVMAEVASARNEMARVAGEALAGKLAALDQPAASDVLEDEEPMVVGSYPGGLDTSL